MFDPSFRVLVIDPAGYVLTNWHVINGFESGIVFLKPVYDTEPDKNSAYGIRLIAESEEADLALLKIVKPPAGLIPVKLGDISSIQVAEDIHVIGHPRDQLWSYSTGLLLAITQKRIFLNIRRGLCLPPTSVSGTNKPCFSN